MIDPLLAGVLVLEGADASGKTTLARYLVERHGARYLHLGPYTDVWRWHLGAFLRAQRLAAAGYLVVVDRHWPSECAYGAVYRSGSAYPVAARCFDRLWLRAAALYVLCVPTDLEAQIERRAATVKARGNAFSTDAARDVRGIVAYYADLARGNVVGHPGGNYLDQWVRFGGFADREDVVTYDLFDEGRDLKAFTAKLLQRLAVHRSRQLPAALDPARPNLTGYPAEARWALVGEAPSPTVRRPDLAYPFMDRCSNLSATTWLNRGLHDLGVREPDLVLVNAHAAPLVTNADPIASELYDLATNYPHLRYVAIGWWARSALLELGVPHSYVPHPQWARRFDHHTPYVHHLGPVLKET